MRENVERLKVDEAESRGRLYEVRKRLYNLATQQMLEATQLKPGDYVLDIAAGTGDQSLEAARRIGSSGRVLSTDISREMLEVANRLANEAGFHNIITQVMNAEQLDLERDQFDAVISRLGLMLIPRLEQALNEIKRVLKPGRWFAALVWSEPERNSLFTIYVDEVAKSRMAQKPESDWRNPFTLANKTRLIHALTQAGFLQVQAQEIPVTFQFSSFEELTNWWGVPFKRAMAELEPELRKRKLDELRQMVRKYEVPQGIRASGELLLGIGRKETPARETAGGYPHYRE